MQFFQKKYRFASPPPNIHIPIYLPQNVINGFFGPSFPGVRLGERAHNTREGLNVVSCRLMKSFVFGVANALRKFAPPLSGAHGEDLVGIIIPTTTTSTTEAQTNVRRRATNRTLRLLLIIYRAKRPEDPISSRRIRWAGTPQRCLVKHANSQQNHAAVFVVEPRPQIRNRKRSGEPRTWTRQLSFTASTT